MPKSEQGVSADRYSIIPRTLIFVTRAESVLLIRGASTKRLWANRYNGIGGHIERGEDALSAARRELAEETGLRNIDLRLAGTVLIDASDRQGIGLFVFRGEVAAQDDARLVESAEGSLGWIPTASLLNFPLVEDLKTLLPRILAMRAVDAPFSALYTYNEQDQMVISFG